MKSAHVQVITCKGQENNDKPTQSHRNRGKKKYRRIVRIKRQTLGSQENDHIREQKAGHGINPNRKPETRCEDWM